MKNIPDRFYDSVIAIGEKDEKGKFLPMATGFLFGHVTHDVDTEGYFNLGFFLVTNRHVIEGRSKIAVRINSIDDETTIVYEIVLIDSKDIKSYATHQEVDLAVIYMDLVPWQNNEIKRGVILTEEIISSVQHYRDLNVTETDKIYLLGYPMGLIGYNKNFPLARAGIISRIGDFLLSRSNTIIIDCQVYPGNSGGPVFLNPIINTNNNLLFYEPGSSITYLLGIVGAYIPYREVAISQQTGNPRIEFQENSGLAIVIPGYFILECIEEFVNYRIRLGGKINKHPFPK